MTRKRPSSTAENAQGTLSYSFDADLFRWEGGQASWFFFRMPADLSAELREQMDGLTGGFGSIRVDAQIGETRWQTSVFPESKTGQYLLPVKAAVRKAEDIEDGDVVPVTLAPVAAEPAAPKRRR